MKKILLVLTVCSLLTACGSYKGSKGDRGDIGPSAPIPTPTPTTTIDVVQEDIDALIKDENDYRLSLGQTELSVGLSCQVAEVVSGQYLSSTYGSPVISTSGKPTYTYLYKGSFTQPDTASGATSLLPLNIRNMYIGKNYRIICSGQIVVRDTDYYSFESKSDDGSLIILDGGVVVANDGNHGMNAVALTGSKFLRRGVHTIQIQYAQTGGGNFGLILTSNNVSIDSKLYYH